MPNVSLANEGLQSSVSRDRPEWRMKCQSVHPLQKFCFLKRSAQGPDWGEIHCIAGKWKEWTSSKCVIHEAALKPPDPWHCNTWKQWLIFIISISQSNRWDPYVCLKVYSPVWVEIVQSGGWSVKVSIHCELCWLIRRALFC